MYYTIVALVITVVMGGIIAYIGDLIGRRFGKRRLSLFGLRPKHTAILITSLTGVLISAVTTIVLFLAVPPVREIIVKGEWALKNNAELRRANKTLNRDNLAEKERAQTAREERHKAELERNSAVTGLKSAQANLNKTLSSLATAKREMAAALTSRDQAVTAMKLAQQQMSIAQRKQKVLTTQIAELEKQFNDGSQQNYKLQRNNNDLEQKNDSLRRINTDLVNTRLDLMNTNKTLASQNEALTANNANLTKTNEGLRADNVKIEADNKRLAAENESWKQLVRNWIPQYNSVYDAYLALRTKRMVVRGGDDLARCVVPANSSPEAVRQIIVNLLHDASDNARSRGAGDMNQVRAVRVVDKQFEANTPTGVTPVTVSGEARVDAVVSKLAWLREPTCVLALAVANSVEKEQALVDLQPLPDGVIYKNKAEIGSLRVDAKASGDILFGELVSFLKQIGQQSLQKGMIPRIDPGSGEPQVGSLGVTDIALLVDRIRAVGDRVRVRAIAPRDITAADPLEPFFRIEPGM